VMWQGQFEVVYGYLMSYTRDSWFCSLLVNDCEII
jgi:hypothetical protein